MKIIFFLLTLFLSLETYGQQVNFTQYPLAAGRLNPSWITVDNSAKLTMLYHDEAIGGYHWNTTLMSASLPFLVKNKMPGAGVIITFQDDKYEVNNAYNQQNLSAGFSYSIWTTPSSYLMLGLGIGFNSRKIGPGNFHTGSQYVPGVGFDPSLPTNEPGTIPHKSFLNVLGGLTYIVKDSLKNNKLMLSGSFTDMNPVNLGGESSENIKLISFNLQSKFRLFARDKYILSPDILYQYFQNIQTVNFGMVNTFVIEDGKNPTILDFTLRYNTNGAGAAIASLEYKRLITGISYQVPVAGKANLQQPNISEISLVYKIGMKGKTKRWEKKKEEVKPKNKVKKKIKRRKKKKVIRKLPAVKKDSISVKSEQSVLPLKDEALKPVAQDSNDMADTTTSAVQDSSKEVFADDYFPEGSLLAARSINKIQFEKNSLMLSPASKIFLDTISIVLRSHPQIKLLIIGHTDDSGDEAINIQLSKARAETVKKYLLDKNPVLQNIITKGMGESKPLLNNTDEASRAVNRRVEFILYK